MSNISIQRSKISGTIQNIVERNNFTIVRDLTGHGVGRTLHESPVIPNYKSSDPDVILKSGMTLAIEPIVSLGGSDIEVLSDNWTVKMKDDSPSAHFEHTVLVTEDGYEILT